MKSKPRFLLWTWRLREKFYVTYVYLPFYLSGGLGDSKIIGKDTKKMSQLHSWLHSRLQNQANSYWSLCYRASSHGWSGSTFHSYCDNRGPTVTIIRAHGYIFGGYTDQSWRCKFVNCHRFCKKTKTIKTKNNRQSSLPFIFENYKKLKILSLWNELSFKTIFTFGSRCQSLITRGSISTGYPHDFEWNSLLLFAQFHVKTNNRYSLRKRYNLYKGRCTCLC